MAGDNGYQDGLTTLDFRDDLMPPKPRVQEFVPLDNDVVEHLRKRLGPTKRESYTNPMMLDDYPSSGDWAF